MSVFSLPSRTVGLSIFTWFTPFFFIDSKQTQRKPSTATNATALVDMNQSHRNWESAEFCCCWSEKHLLGDQKKWRTSVNHTFYQFSESSPQIILKSMVNWNLVANHTQKHIMAPCGYSRQKEGLPVLIAQILIFYLAQPLQYSVMAYMTNKRSCRKHYHSA